MNNINKLTNSGLDTQPISAMRSLPKLAKRGCFGAKSENIFNIILGVG